MNATRTFRPHLLSHAPAELTRTRLHRLGEGIGKVVYASDHWVVKRERTSREIIALILVWKLLRSVAGKRLLRQPSRWIRLLRVGVQAVMLVVPRSLWFTTHVLEMWKLYRTRDWRGARLATEHLEGTDLAPERVSFPPTRVEVGGWPGWLTVCEATERVEETLYARIEKLARAQRFDEVELWLERFLALRPEGWRRGIFDVDAHLKNFGVCGERIVLLDSGGLTDRWTEIENRLRMEERIDEPHTELGLGELLQARPEIAQRFDERWKSLVNRASVRRFWPKKTA